ncbi:hypothetical protein DEO72_LG2g3727 [Vigna unguiculata]|uniref:Uncharacterized protein n=1 Tax=Vigna unguiculata TaxID=3917 RepID=A0A4D6L4E5_VIGUN|nr:hypothetical protein DEO72_LG2g3727 [Vigna unguiculata]
MISARRFSSRHSPFPLTERSARVCPKVHFELAQTQFLLRDSSASYRAAKAFVNPSSRRFSSRHSPFPLTERSARVCPKVHFELAQTQFLLRLFSRS